MLGERCPRDPFLAELTEIVASEASAEAILYSSSKDCDASVLKHCKVEREQAQCRSENPELMRAGARKSLH